MYRIENGQQDTENNTISRFHQIQYTVRESLAIQGGLPTEIQSKIDQTFDSYLNSEKYKNDFEELYQSLQWSSPDYQKLEKAFKTGLLSNIKYSQTNLKLAKIPESDIIKSYNLHCQETAKNLRNSPDFSQGKKRNGVLYTIISCPRLYPPDIFNRLCKLIEPNGFVSLAVITSLIEKQTPSIQDVINQKSKIFQQIVVDSMTTKLDLSIEQIKMIIVQNSNPVDFLERKCAGKKSEQTSRVNLDRLIRQLSRIQKELDIIEDKFIPPKKFAEILKLTEGIHNRAKGLKS